MKLLKNWKFILLISLISLYSIFGLHVFLEESKLPSKDFSRHIEIANIQSESFQESRNDSTITSTKLDNGNLAILYYDKTLKYIELSSDANIIKELDMNIEFDNLNQIKLKSLDLDILNFYVLEASNLYSYSFNSKSKDLKKELIYVDVKSIYTSKNYITLISKTGFSVIKDENSLFKEIYTSENSPRNMTNLIEDNGLHFSYLANDEKGVQKLFYYSYLESNKSSIIKNIATIPSSGNYSTSSISMIIEDDLASILQEGMDYKTGISTLTIFKETLDTKSNINFKKAMLNDLKYASGSILVSSSSDNFSFVARIPNDNSDSEIAHDIYLFTYENFELIKAKKLTKSAGNSSNPSYIKTDNSNYLVWTDSVGLNKRILIAGDNEGIIANSYNLNKNDMLDVFMAIVFTLSPTLFAFILPLLSIAGPILFLLIVLSFVNLTYLERNGKKLLKVILVLHLILKFRFIYSILFETMSEVKEFLPAFISNTYLLTLFMIGLTLISFLITYLKNPKFLNGQDIWMTYISFMLIDTIIVWIAIMPYLYMWLDVSSKNFV